MKKVFRSQSFFENTKEDPSIRELFVSLGFKPMANDITYNTIGKTITLEKALEFIGKSESDVVAFFKEKGVDIAFYE